MSKQDRDEDRPQYQPGASEYRPQTVESDDEVNREIASEFDDRIDPEMSDGDIETENSDDESLDQPRNANRS